MKIATMNRELKTLSDLAFHVGCAEDQLHRFLSYGYVPQRKQLQFHAAARECDEDGGPEWVAYGGTRGQAKSHAILAQATMDDMQRFPGIKVLYLRKIAKRAGESFEDLRKSILRFVPHDSKAGSLTLPNGSFIILGGYRTEGDIDGYLGIQYDMIIIEDATTLTKSKFNAIRGSLRTSREDFQPRGYASFNPGGVGHAWAKKNFYDDYKRGREKDTRFVHAKMGDNKFINKRYEKYLNALTGWLRRAWRDGDMEIAAGQFFTTWNEEIHVIEPFGIPHDWPMWASMDYGLIHWNMTYVLAKDGENNYYVICEHAARRQLVKQNADGIKAMLGRNGIRLPYLREFVAGHDIFIRRGNTEVTIAESYAKEGIHLEPATLDRINGAARIASLLGNADADPPIPSRLFIFNTCSKLIDCIPLMQHDPGRSEDVLKVDSDEESGEGGDDPYDSIRYGLMVDHREVTVHNYG